jgi:hypothetical protein
VPLLVEATDHLLVAGQPEACLRLIDESPAPVRDRGRIRLQRCRALLALGRGDEARALLDAGIEVADLREGETLESVWRAAYGDSPLPATYDFRMTPD